MTRQSSCLESPSAFAQMKLAAGVSCGFLSVQWLVVSRLGLTVQQDRSAGTPVALAALGMALGLAAGGAAIAVRRFRPNFSTAVSLPLSIIVSLEVMGIARGPKGITFGQVAVAIACGIVACLLVGGVGPKLPARIRQADTWWLIAGFGFGGALLGTAVKAVDTPGALVAIAGGLAAVFLVVRGIRSDHRGPCAFLACALSVLTGAVLGQRVPLYEPDVHPKPKRPSVLLITIDTLRADDVGVYGYNNARTPNLDALAAEGVMFRQTVTANVHTGPSHTTMLTGLLPERHGVLTNMERIPDPVLTLTDVLREEGYVTGAFVSSLTAADAACGLPSRFHVFDDNVHTFDWLPEEAYRVGALRVIREAATKLVPSTRYGFYGAGAKTADVAIAWLGRNGGPPFFVWVHLFDPHLPYCPPQKYIIPSNEEADPDLSGRWDSKTAQMINLYDAEIAYADEQVGRLVDAARRAAPEGKLLIVAASDHGESMGEHGLFWRRDLYDPTLLVPLIVVPPDASGSAGRQIDTQVRLVDLTPTILEIIGLSSSEELDGRSLVGLMRGASTESPGPAFSGCYPIRHNIPRERHSVREKGWKLIRGNPGWDASGLDPVKDASQELYNLSADPRAARPIISQTLSRTSWPL